MIILINLSRLFEFLRISTLLSKNYTNFIDNLVLILFAKVVIGFVRSFRLF